MNTTVLTTDFNGDINCLIGVYIQIHRNLLSLGGVGKGLNMFVEIMSLK